MSLPTGLSRRNGVWQLRIGVPNDLAHLYDGPDAFRSSLRTRHQPEAVTKAHALIHEWRDKFDQQRAALLPRSTPASPRLTVELSKRLEHRVLSDDDFNAVEGERLGLIPVPPEILGITKLSDDPAERFEQIAQAVEDFTNALAALFASGDYDMARHYGHMIAEEIGIPSVDWSAAPAELPKFARAVVRVYRALLDRASGEPIDTPDEPTPLDVAPATKPRSEATTHTLHEVFEEWKVGQKRDSIGKTKRALAKVETAGIPTAIETLTRRDGLSFRQHILDTMPKASGKTRSDVLSCIQALLNFAVKERGWIDSNPWAGTTIAKGRRKKRDTWDDDELATLFNTPLTTDRRLDLEAQYWIPLIAVLTGARQAEICQLRTADVLRREGVWLLDINEEGEDKSVKSDAGVRRVAIHSKLVELGFIEYVDKLRQSGETLVFPRILKTESRSPQLYVSDWFRDRCRSIGLYRRYRDFHSFRTTVDTALKAVVPPLGPALITAILGHEPGDVGSAHYHQPGAKSLQRVIESLDFPAVLALKRTA